MKDIMIKIVVIILGVSVYFNVSSYIEEERLQDDISRLEDVVESLGTLNDQLISRIEDLEEEIELIENQEEQNTEDQSNDTDPSDEPDDTPVDSCLKLFEISIVVVNDHEDFNETVIHCTNQSTLGDALEELQVSLSVVFDPRYSKEYVYGRMVHSFYGFGRDMEEYYALYVNDEYSQYGIDFTELEDGNTYSFILTRWDY